MRTPTNIFRTLGLVLACFGFINCGPIDHVEQMAETTRDLRKVADDLQKELDANLLLAKEVAGKTKREQCLAEMGTSKAFETMVMQASCYFMSFNFQVWTGLGEDTPERREDLFTQAVEEFTFTLPDTMVTRWWSSDLTGHAGDAIWDFEIVKSIAPGMVDEKARALNFYALAATLHRTHELQNFFLEVEGLQRPEVSMYDLLYQSLVYANRERAQLLTPAEIPPWAVKALAFETNVRKLLRARVVTLTTTALLYASRLPQRSRTDAFWFRHRYLESSPFNLFRPGWRPDYTTIYQHELALYTEWLELAEQGLSDLEALDLAPEPVVFRGLSRLLLDHFTVDTSYVADDPVTDEAIHKFEAAVDSIRDRIVMQLAD